MEIPIHIGLRHIQADSIFLVWPDNSYQRIADSTRGEAVFSYRPGLPKFDYSKIAAFQKLESRRVVDITTQEKLSFRHKENPFPEFDREPLIPHMLSTEGPGLAVADINGDGLDDIFIGSSKGEKPGIFIQDASGKFSVTSQPALDALEQLSPARSAALFFEQHNFRYALFVLWAGGVGRCVRAADGGYVRPRILF